MNPLTQYSMLAQPGRCHDGDHEPPADRQPVPKINASVVDTMHGRPAEGIAVRLERRVDGQWRDLAQGHTDESGGLTELFSGMSIGTGVYRLELDVDAYFASLGLAAFHPTVTVAFRVRNPTDDCHIPILITPHSQQTYRST